jgi:hypothetical protein
VSLLWKIVKWTAISLASLCVLIAFVAFGTHLWQQRVTHDCPILAWITPVRPTPIQPGDSLQLALQFGRPGGFGGDTVRVYGDGHIERDTTITDAGGLVVGCPLHEADKHLRIPAAQASALIAQARDHGFCRLCRSYRRAAYDAAFEELTLSLGNKVKKTENYAGDPPPIFREVEDSLLALSPPTSYSDQRNQTPERHAECQRFEDDQLRADQIRHPEKYNHQ